MPFLERIQIQLQGNVGAFLKTGAEHEKLIHHVNPDAGFFG
jgi:hypothetical protein